MRETVAMGECLTGHVSTHANPADICTKLIPGGQKHDHHGGADLIMTLPITIDNPLLERFSVS